MVSVLVLVPGAEDREEVNCFFDLLSSHLPQPSSLLPSGLPPLIYPYIYADLELNTSFNLPLDIQI